MAQQIVTGADAINQAFKEEMRRDKRVVMWGEDLISMGGSKTTEGIFEEFGPNRILDTPIVEDAIVGMAVGAACVGLRPVAHLMAAGFMPIALDQVFAKLGSNFQEWRQRGPVPVVIFATVSTGAGGTGGDHSLSPEALLIHSPGLKVVMPATAYDAKGLLKSSIRDDYPVVFLAHRAIFFEKQSIPTEEYLVPLGKADVKRPGKDVTIVSYSAMLIKALKAAEQLSKEGIDAEVVDLRTLVPLDIETVVQSVNKTRRLIIANEAYKRGGVAGEITLRFIEAAPDLVKSLKSPITRVAAPNIALPHGAALQRQIVPQADDIVKAVKKIV
ncbi:MAG: transketolase C-terminal domain-containing protein [Dehalococcoidales bacterium]|nr:transketolase C-terminal domain-containing protein [Dehalococcoidales bacterium]